MRTAFVETKNAQRFKAALGGYERRGASEACWVLVAGRPGVGKTQVTAVWAARYGAAIVRLHPACTPTWVLTDLVAAMGGVPRRTAAALVDQARELMGQRRRPILLDEAEEGFREGARVLDAVRAISDRFEVPVVLAGRERLPARMAQYQQLLGRVAPEAIALFEAAGLEDVAKMREAMTGIEAGPGLDELILERTGGVHREIMHALAALQRSFRGQREPVSGDEAAGVIADRAGASRAA